MDPPARNAMWRFGFPNPVNYNDNELFCGGYAGKCVVNHINHNLLILIFVLLCFLFVDWLFLAPIRTVQWEQNFGNCGVCGDAYHLQSPRPHEAGGEYAKGIISKFYTAGQVSVVPLCEILSLKLENSKMAI